MISDGRIIWRYYAGDGEVNMGAFDISCRLLDITGDKMPRWIDFSVSFRPEFPD